MELRLYRSDVLSTAISSVCNLLANCTGELKYKSDTRSDLTAHCINEVASTLRKRGEDKYLSVEVDLYNGDDKKTTQLDYNNPHDVFHDIYKKVTGTPEAASLLTILNDLHSLEDKGTEDEEIEGKWRNISRVINFAATLNTGQLDKLVDDMSKAVPELLDSDLKKEKVNETNGVDGSSENEQDKKSDDDAVLKEEKPGKRRRYRTKKRIKEENLETAMPEVKVGQVFIDICEQVGGAKGLRYTLNMESKITKKGAKVFKCSLCSEVCKNVSGIKRHNAAEHILPFTCSHCGEGYSDRDELAEHSVLHEKEGLTPQVVLESDSMDKKHACDLCHKRFKSEIHLDRHVLTHSGLRPTKVRGKAFTGDKIHRCPTCNKTFAYGHTLKAHLRIHDGIRHPCEVCGKLFKHAYNLKVHMFDHTGGGKYECKICNKKFGVRSMLKKHSIKHTTHKPYQCDICGKAFPLPWRLKKHARIHSGVKNFICNLCGKAFVTPDNLRQHVKTHNKDPNNPPKPRARKPAQAKVPPAATTNIPQGTIAAPVNVAIQQLQQQLQVQQLPIQVHSVANLTEQPTDASNVQGVISVSAPMTLPVSTQVVTTVGQQQLQPQQVAGAPQHPGQLQQLQPAQPMPPEAHQQIRTQNQAWDFAACQFRPVFPGFPGFPGYQC